MTRRNEAADIIIRDLEGALAKTPRPLVYGIAGAQGSGKSTIAQLAMAHFAAQKKKIAVLSIDDLYYGREERRRIAARTHPLFITRGPPGTHDVGRGIAILDALKAHRPARLPRFSKAMDEPLPMAEWEEAPGDLEILIFEGWCLGARSEPVAALDPPINILEEIFDANGRWRRAVNTALGGGYQGLFARIDRLAYLRPPNFEIVGQWRWELERALAAAKPAREAPGLLDEDEIDFFVQHYERITRAMMAKLPKRAALTVQLDERRRVIG
ncbi:MAG: kinase [Parvularculaceae bacterium]